MTNNEFKVDLLFFAPHPDDVELWCGGLVVKMTQAGYRVGIAELTKGELGTRGDVATREAECKASSKVLGVTLRENLGFPDGGIDATTSSQLNRTVELLRELRPELVVIPYEQERHPDHVAASTLLNRALFFANTKKFTTGGKAPRFMPRQVLSYPMRHVVRPSFVVDISDVQATKMKAISCFKSQLFDPKHKEEDQTLLSSPETLQVIETRDRYYGAMIGKTFGEPFQVTNLLAIGDPLEFFRKNSNMSAQLFPVD